MYVRDVVAGIDRSFPLSGAASWDVVGLQIGDPEAQAGRVAVCHEMTERVVADAVDAEITTLITYHPVLFTPTVRLVAGPTAEGRALAAARAGINVVVVHTAMDAASGGTGDHLLDVLGLEHAGSFGSPDEPEETWIGRVGTLKGPVEPATLAELVSRRLDVVVRMAAALGTIERIAVIPGSGASLLGVASDVADAIVTGDISHHRAVAVRDRGTTLIDAGHAATERPGVAALYAAVCTMVPGAIHLSDDPTPWGT